MMFAFRLNSIFVKLLKNNVRFASNSDLVDVAINDKSGIATITLQRHPVNSLNTPLLEAIIGAVNSVAGIEPKGMILTSSCKTTFSSGLDLHELQAADKQSFLNFWSLVRRTYSLLLNTPFPTAAAINGHAPAGGCLLSICCDYRAMVQGKYIIGLNETAVGSYVQSWVINIYRSVLPARVAEQAILVGKLFSVEEAFKAGLIDDVVGDQNDAIAKCTDFIESFKLVHPKAHSITKARSRATITDDLRTSNDTEEMSHFYDFFRRSDTQKHIEGVLDALKRKPKKI